MQMENQAQMIEKASDERKEGDIGLATASRSADAPRPTTVARTAQNSATI
jgi:hypothetical protein